MQSCVWPCTVPAAQLWTVCTRRGFGELCSGLGWQGQVVCCVSRWYSPRLPSLGRGQDSDFKPHLCLPSLRLFQEPERTVLQPRPKVRRPGWTQLPDLHVAQNHLGTVPRSCTPEFICHPQPETLCGRSWGQQVPWDHRPPPLGWFWPSYTSGILCRV